MRKLPPSAVILFNLLIVILLTAAIKGRILNQCGYPEINALCWGAAILLLLQVIWRHLRSSIKNLIGGVEIGMVKLAGKPIMNLISRLHLTMLPTGGLYVLLVVFALVPFIARSPNFPFRPSENVPVIKGFSIQYLPSTSPQFHPPGDTITVLAGHQILVEAIIIGDFAEPCEWYAVKGTFLQSGKCSILYTHPIEKSGDSLMITANSSCGTLQTSKGLLIAP